MATKKISIPRICSIDGCDRVHEARGWCHTHFERNRRNGSPTAHRLQASGAEARFDHYTHLIPFTTCHWWTGPVSTSGYGRFCTLKDTGRKDSYAHRYAWERVNGPIPANMHICHTCDNKLCVNIDHLFIGTMADNMADMDSKGRRSYGIGRAKLAPPSVAAIRRACCQVNSQTYQQIGERYGVSPSAVREIAKGRSWPHIDPDDATTWTVYPCR